MRGSEGISGKVGDPIMKLVVTRPDEAFLIAVEGVADVKCRTTSIEMFQQVGRVNAIWRGVHN